MFTKLFFSYAWDKNTKNKLILLKSHLEKLDFNVWIDQENIFNDIDSSMVTGINNSEVILIFISKKYYKKIDNASKRYIYTDNCFKECSYSVNSGKLCIPVIIDTNMLNINNWKPGLMKFYFGNKLYIDATGNDYNKISLEIKNYIEKTSFRIENLTPLTESEINSPPKFYKLKKNIKLLNTLLKFNKKIVPIDNFNYKKNQSNKFIYLPIKKLINFNSSS